MTKSRLGIFRELITTETPRPPVLNDARRAIVSQNKPFKTPIMHRREFREIEIISSMILATVNHALERDARKPSEQFPLLAHVFWPNLSWRSVGCAHARDCDRCGYQTS
jgi:hypothetical protein